jgi:hypothetical protein
MDKQYIYLVHEQEQEEFLENCDFCHDEFDIEDLVCYKGGLYCERCLTKLINFKKQLSSNPGNFQKRANRKLNRAPNTHIKPSRRAGVNPKGNRRYRVSKNKFRRPAGKSRMDWRRFSGV